MMMMMMISSIFIAISFVGAREQVSTDRHKGRPAVVGPRTIHRPAGHPEALCWGGSCDGHQRQV